METRYILVVYISMSSEVSKTPINPKTNGEYVIHLTPSSVSGRDLELDSLPWHKNHGKAEINPKEVEKERQRILDENWLHLDEW